MRLQTFVLLTLSWSVTSRDYDDDEGRPYEFGFTIDGQQHRHESKDVNGIIMGEFGFITADGIYHVTVYATDENGSFKILSMKNIRISGPLDEPGYKFPSKSPTKTDGPPKINIRNPESIPAPIVSSTTLAPSTNFKAPYVFTTLPSLKVPACSSCRLPSTTPKPPGASNKLPFQTPQFQNQNSGNNPNVPFNNNNQKQIEGGNYENLDNGFQNNGKVVEPSVEQQPPFQKITHENLQNPPESINLESFNKPNLPNFNNQSPSKINYPESRDIKTPVSNPQDIYPNLHNPSLKQSRPITVSNQQINIPGRDPIPIKDPYPNMVDGLPDGITEKDMLDILYKFNYTLSFHGHHEKGLKNGAKIGAYFVNGRDGISRVVEYIADENGYRPKVKFINLGLDSPDTPKEGTEKTFGLKGFEFVWFPI